MKKSTSPKLRDLVSSTVVGVEAVLLDENPFSVTVVAAIRLKDGGIWRATWHELRSALSTAQREVGRRAWAPAIRDLLTAHVQTIDDAVENDPSTQAKWRTLWLRAELRMLARTLRDRLQRHGPLLTLKEVREILDVERTYREAVVDDVHTR